MTPRVSIVIPTYNEGAAIETSLNRILEAVTIPCEILVVYDSPSDTTAEYAKKYAQKDTRVVPTVNTWGRGPANAMRFGISKAKAPTVVITMADGSDDPRQIDALVYLIERGVVVASASRYVRGGQQVGGPWLKGKISRLACLSLYHLGGVGTHDATNSFKGYSKAFIDKVGIESEAGFEMGIELVAKAKRLGLPVAELPTIWLDRTEGQSNFKVKQWIPRYLRWYFYAIRLDPLAQALTHRNESMKDSSAEGENS